jgi:hypothetical protein
VLEALQSVQDCGKQLQRTGAEFDPVRAHQPQTQVPRARWLTASGPIGTKGRQDLHSKLVRRQGFQTI